jgi:protein-S-isoprenylcysteine O-methyltransferase Ste14
VPPPLFFVLPFLAGLGVNLKWPAHLIPASMAYEVRIVAWGGVGLFGVLCAWCLVYFFLARTAVMPNRPARKLVVSGPYRLARNPMYLSLIGAYLFAIPLFNTPWPLPFFLIPWAVVRFWIIPREEAHLRAVFPDEYRTYCDRVGRWLFRLSR